MKFRCLRQVVFQPNLKQVLTVHHVKLTIVIIGSWLACVRQVNNACARLLGTKEAKELHKLSTVLATVTQCVHLRYPQKTISCTIKTKRLHTTNKLG